MDKKTILRRGVKTLGTGLILCGIAMLAAGAYFACRFGNAKAVTPPASQCFAAGKNDFKVAFFGDFAMQSQVFIPVLKQISAEKPDFAISVGDMFRKPEQGEGPYLTEMLFDHLAVPFCTAPGNHDVIDPNGFATYCRYFGDLHYFFSFGDTLFVVLNDNVKLPVTPEIKKILPQTFWDKKRKMAIGMDADQIAWLKNILAHYRKDFRRCILVMHAPPVEPAMLGDCKPEIIVGHQLEPIVKTYPVDAIVSGHLHVSAQSDFKGVPVYHVPCCGQMMRDKIHPDFGYLTLHFTSSGTIEATPHYLPGLKRGRNYFLNSLVSLIPGNRRYYYFALLSLVAGLALLAAARKRS